MGRPVGKAAPIGQQVGRFPSFETGTGIRFRFGNEKERMGFMGVKIEKQGTGLQVGLIWAALRAEEYFRGWD
jgi:hypothetical protein